MSSKSVDFKRLLKVALIGAPNAGKSTLLNRLVGTDVSSVSKKVHTTRRNVFGVYTRQETQLEFYDSPGLITRQHLLKHQLEDSLYYDPKAACQKCDLIAVVVDASNIREQRRLNKGVIELLTQYPNIKSFLVMNKVDLVKDKRMMLDMGTRLTQGCLEGHLIMDKNNIARLSYERIRELNLTAHLPKSNLMSPKSSKPAQLDNKYVIELDNPQTNMNNKNPLDDINNPDRIGYKNFSQVFSISALKDDGIENFRNKLIELAYPVERWPHNADFVSNVTTREVVGSIIRGKIMDYVEYEVPYLVKLNFLKLSYDDYGSLHVTLLIDCPRKYMVPRVLGKAGTVIARVIEESRDIISKNFGCDVNLNIEVQGPNSLKRGI